MSNNKLKSTAHSIVQGMSSSLLVVHQYTHAWITLTLCIVLRKFDANSFEMSSLILQHRCTCFCTHIPHKVLWIQYCQLLSSFIQSVFILTDYSCLLHERCMSDHSTIQRCLRKTNIFPQKAFHVMCVSQKYPPTISELITVVAGHHSSGDKGDMIKQSSTELELRHILFQPHKLSIQVIIFRLP